MEGKGRIHRTVIFKLPLAFQTIPNLIKTCVVKSQFGDLWLLGFLVCIWEGREDEAKEEEEISKET